MHWRCRPPAGGGGWSISSAGLEDVSGCLCNQHTGSETQAPSSGNFGAAGCPGLGLGLYHVGHEQSGYEWASAHQLGRADPLSQKSELGVVRNTEFGKRKAVVSERKSGGGREGALGPQGTHEANEDRRQGSPRASGRTTEGRVKWPGTDRAWGSSRGSTALGIRPGQCHVGTTGPWFSSKWLRAQAVVGANLQLPGTLRVT